ncbi:MAG: ATP-binding cassette domain-containing protein [Bacilli bacterium]|nr:ATP-binding cassette domain-containing protein [Bacilli bacterium]
MSLLKVTDVKFNYSDKELFNGLNFQLNLGDHAVLVGQNGCGKTTIFDLLTKKLTPDKGTITWTPHVTYSYLDQHYKVNDNFTVKDFLEQIYKDLFLKEQRMNELFEKGSNTDDPNYIKYLEQATKINDELIMSDFYSIKEEIDKVIVGLGIPKEYKDRQLNILSSGQREKVYLAKMLLEQHDVLLLDEPTNYLDQMHVRWLAEYLKNYKKSFLVISHDEAFLNEIANVVFCLANKNLERYKGDYAYYKEQSVVRKEQYEKNYEAQQRFIKKEEQFIAAHIVRATSSRAAKSRRARLAHVERLEPPKDDTNQVYFNFPYSGDIGNEILSVNGLVIGYEKPLLNPISFELRKGEKIAIVGKNGIGKSTLLKTLLKIIPSLSGEFKFNENSKISYFSQTEMDDLSVTPMQFIQSKRKVFTNLEVRSLLARCGIKAELALRPLKELSGGEEAKTRLCELTLEKSNILVFDEPTNHLDKVAKQSLKEAIEDYPGVVILVSHEKEFYEDLVDYIIKLD